MFRLSSKSTQLATYETQYTLYTPINKKQKNCNSKQYQVSDTITDRT